MSEVKYCPECDTEYYAHIDECVDCGVGLKTPDELKDLKVEQTGCKESPQKGVAVREGERKWIKELSQVLGKRGFSYNVVGSKECSPGKCGDTYFLVVPEEEAERAVHAIEEYYDELHPELRISREASNQGKCPACGHDTGVDAKECPDCGLFLVM